MQMPAVHIDTILDAAADLLRQVRKQADRDGNMDPMAADCLLAMRDQMIQLLCMLGDGHKTLSKVYRFVPPGDFEKMRRYEHEATKLLKMTPQGDTREVVGITVAHPRVGAIAQAVSGVSPYD